MACSVSVQHLGKKFGLTLRSALKYGVADTCRRIIGKGKDDRLRPGEFWALKDVNFELEAGDALGIMGVNGSGKTTLLRILNGAYTPDTGRVELRGRIGALIAAGAGFSPMLTGRENVFISGTLLGMSPAELRERFDEIVDFANLGEFIDMPVRNYSSGMTVRLGFAIAVLGQPEILLVDEVLAVGDIAFQKKCYELILKLRSLGTIILFVSHSIGAVWSICNRAMLLDAGECLEYGNVEDVIRGYEERNFHNNLSENRGNETEKLEFVKTDSDSKENERKLGNAIGTDYSCNYGGTGDVLIDYVRIENDEGQQIREVSFGATFVLVAKIQIKKKINFPLIRYTFDSRHYKFIGVIDSYESNCFIEELQPGVYIIKTKILKQEFRPGTYVLNFAVMERSIGIHLVFLLGAGSFVVRHPRDRFLYADDNAIIGIESDFEIKNCPES